MANKKSIKNKKNKQQPCFLCRLTGILFLSSLLLLLPFLPLTARAEGPALWDGSAASAFAGGTGTENDPYLISNGKELKFFSNKVNAGTTYQGQYIKLTNDILLNEMNANGTFVSGSPREFTPIGGEGKPFEGHFDGAGYEIIGLHIVEKHWISYQGLFGYALESSVISNCTVSGKLVGKEFVGGIVGCTKGKVSECNSFIAVTGWKTTGGIVGYAVGINSEIINCNFSGTVSSSGSFNMGGIAGQTEGLIDGCSVVDAVIIGESATSGAKGGIGGIAGYAKGEGSIIRNCSVSGTVKAVGGYGNVGGVAGEADGKITGCTCVCEVTGEGQHLVGGVVGSAGTGSEISNSSSSGDVTGKGKVGGIAGYTDGDITICINTGNVNGNSGYIGGVAGDAGNNSNVSNSYNSGDVYGAGQGCIGGIVGHVGSGTVVHHNLNKGTVEGSQYVGSIFGNMPGEGNAWNNYYDDYDGAPGGSGTGVHSSGDIGVGDDEGAVPVGDWTWEEVWEKLNEDNEDEDGNPIWNQDMDDEGIPKPGGDGESTGPQGAFEVQQSVIKEGKHYGVTILEETDAGVVTVTADSVFTAAFSLKYDEGSNPGEHKIRLNEIGGGLMEFPEGASIIMLADGSYYYTNLDGLTAGVTEITLKNLMLMGSTAQTEGAAEYYNPAPVAKDAEKVFLFIFDFSRAATSEQAESLSYRVELTNSAGNYDGTAPLVNITGKNSYGLSVSSAGGSNTFTFSFTGPEPVPGYDDKTAGKVLAFELYLEKEGVNGRIPLPFGTKINQSGDLVSFVSAAQPYAFLPESFTPVNPLSLVINLDLAGCAVPLVGNYKLVATAYACTDPLDFLTPRGGYILAESGPQEISLAAPVAYAIRASASARAFDRPDDPDEQIAVTFTIQTRGSDNVKATLQRKYGKTYVDVAGEENKSVEPSQGSGTFAGNGSSATLTFPAGTAQGTYRFLLILYDEGGTLEKARTVKNIIVK